MLYGFYSAPANAAFAFGSGDKQSCRAIKSWLQQLEYAFENQIIRILNKVHASIDRNEQRLSEQDRRELTELEWKQASIVLDRLLLAVFLLITIISTTTILCRSPANDTAS